MASIAIEWAMSNSPGPGALLAPGLDEIAVPVELDHLRLAASVALHHEDLAGRAERQVVGLVEQAQMAILVHLARVPAHAQHQHDAPLRAELVDHVRGDVGRPDIVLRVDPQPMRPVEEAGAERADELAARVELHQRVWSAMQDEDVALGVDRHARGAAERHARRQGEALGYRHVVERRLRGRLRDGKRGRERGHQCTHQQDGEGFHGDTADRSVDEVTLP